MIIDGKHIAREIQTELIHVKAERGPVTLAIITVGPSTVTEKYLHIKKSFADTIGVSLHIETFPSTCSEEEVNASIRALNDDSSIQGIVVQLPLPNHLDTNRVLHAIAPKKDVDGLRSGSQFMSPVSRAVHEVMIRHNITLQGQSILVVGQGRLVGQPITQWLRKEGVGVVTADDTTENLPTRTRSADIIISGAGVPHLITPDMVHDNVVLIDVGTSEAAGKLVGDIDPQCASKALLYSPVPGGMGPITVAMLFKNLLEASCGILEKYEGK